MWLSMEVEFAQRPVIASPAMATPITGICHSPRRSRRRNAARRSNDVGYGQSNTDAHKLWRPSEKEMGAEIDRSNGEGEPTEDEQKGSGHSPLVG